MTAIAVTQLVASRSYPALTSIKAGRVVKCDGTNTSKVSDTDQATTQTVATYGITLSDAEAGERPEIGIGGDIPFRASGACAVGDKLVAKYSADADVDSCLTPIGTHTAGDVIVAICTVAAADGQMGMCRYVGHMLK